MTKPAPYYFAMNMMDLLVTFWGVYGMGFNEGNPIAAQLIPYPFWLCVFKIAGTLIVIMIMSVQKEKRFVVWHWCLTTMVGFVVLSWMIAIINHA